jgi:cell division protein FtsW
MSTTLLDRRGAGSAAMPNSSYSRNAGGLTACVLALVVFGLVMVMSASAVASMEKGQGAFGIFVKQFVFALGGLGIMAYLSRIDYNRLRYAAIPLLVVVTALLGLVLVPGIGTSAGGASRWIALGGIGVQPSEFAKLAFVLFAAAALAGNAKRPETAAEFLIPTLPAVLILGALIMAQPDLGTTITLGIAFFGVLWAAGLPLPIFGWLAGLSATAFVALALSADYRKARLLSFIDPWASADSEGYHAVQSMLAIGSGGWTGVGLGAGRQKWLFLPNAHTDFVFAVIGEELGFVGCLAVILLFSTFAFFGIRTALRAPDRFGRVLAGGITAWISLQAFINIGVTSGRLPVTGIPLPFLSTGGSALLTVLAASGILLSIARRGDAVAEGRTR